MVQVVARDHDNAAVRMRLGPEAFTRNVLEPRSQPFECIAQPPRLGVVAWTGPLQGIARDGTRDALPIRLDLEAHTLSVPPSGL